nr:reverse transcriptase [Solanum melongena]WMB97012.1 reverse transcriptase [Solanum aethiopicum]
MGSVISAIDRYYRLYSGVDPIPGLTYQVLYQSYVNGYGEPCGKAIKVDHNTRFAATGRYARVCVEVDLNKPLVPRIHVDGQWQSVEYEGLPMICFKCGRTGHRDCPYVTTVNPEVKKNNEETGEGRNTSETSLAMGGEKSEFGPFAYQLSSKEPQEPSI